MQVGDPFEEKKLLECSLELLERGLLVSLQDLGAAGLTSSAAEMASKGEVGIDIDVARIPLREPGMEPFEIMVSESQERMLCVAAPADVPAVLGLCEKWEVGGAAIGTVTDTRRMRIFDGERLVGDMPVRALVDDCPLYDLQPARPAAPIYAPPPAALPPTPPPARRCSRCCARRTSPRAARSSSSTTRSCSPARCAAPSRPTPRCSRCAPAAIPTPPCATWGRTSPCPRWR